MKKAGSSGRLVVAIDGPAGAGKSTVAKMVAERLGYIYVDTGAMYRAVTLKALSQHIDVTDADALTTLAVDTLVELGIDGSVKLDGVDVTREIRSPAVSKWVSQVAAVPGVRSRLVDVQRQLARAGGIVMDGRDIGTHVLPDAERKFFVTASVEERAARRHRELLAGGHRLSQSEVMSDMIQRDIQDETRGASPLVKAPDAVFIDTTGLTVEQVVNKVFELCQSGPGSALDSHS